jgi:hypothetical protein
VQDKKTELTWRLGSEGPSEEVTRIRSGLTVLFFGGGDGFRRSFSVASSMVFFLRVGSLLKGGVVRPKLEAVPVA